MVPGLSPVSERASCRPRQVCRYPFRQPFKAPTKEEEAKNHGFSAQLAHVPEFDKGCNTQPTYQVWVSDITYIPIKISDCESEFAYLSLITYACSHEVIGWRLGRDLSNKPALQALSMAFRAANDRGVDICSRGLVHHSDRGVQYASKEYIEMLRSARVGISKTE